MLHERANEVLDYWFGDLLEASLPEADRSNLWFGNDEGIDKEIKEKFLEDVNHAIAGDYKDWEDDPRGRLALIILLDQFSRHIYRDSPEAYVQDNLALEICLEGVHEEQDNQR